MWSPNEISKQEKQRDIFAYITLPFFQVKKGSLSTFRFTSRPFLHFLSVETMCPCLGQIRGFCFPLPVAAR